LEFLWKFETISGQQNFHTVCFISFIVHKNIYAICPLGVLSGLRHIVQKETFFALYKGNGAQMVRIFPYAATQFTAFELYKKVKDCFITCGSLIIGWFCCGVSDCWAVCIYT